MIAVAPPSPLLLPTEERDARGALLALNGGGRCYVRAAGSTRVFGEGLAEVDEVDLPRGRLRSTGARRRRRGRA